MKSRLCILRILVIVLLSALSGISAAQTMGEMTASEALAALKPDQWLKLEGRVQQDLTVLCTEMKIYATEATDENWKIDGIIRGIDGNKREFSLLGLVVKPHKDAKFTSDSPTFKSFDDLKAGMLVGLEGTYLKDGVFLANQIDDRSKRLAKKPELKHDFDATGKAGRVDVGKRTITLMGIRCQITDQTQIKTASTQTKDGKGKMKKSK